MGEEVGKGGGSLERGTWVLIGGGDFLECGHLFEEMWYTHMAWVNH